MYFCKMNQIDLKIFSLNKNRPLNVQKNCGDYQTGKKFIKGPISLKWISKAARLPGKALHVALVLKFLEGVTRKQKIPLSNRILKIFGVDRYAKARSLKELEKANLIVVTRKRGRSPIVKILSIE